MTRDIGSPNTLLSDIAGEKTVPNTEPREFIHICRIDGRTTEPYSPWKNRVEGMIKIVKEKDKPRIIRRRAPKFIWDFFQVR